MEPFDLVFLAMKSYDTEWATHFILPHLSENGAIVSAQNGINDERIGPIAGWSRVLGCVITLGAGMYEPANPIRTSIASRLAFTIGEPSGIESVRARAISDMLGAVGPTKVTPNLWGHRWAKLATNSMANPICALTGLGSAASRDTPGVVDVTIKIGAEVVRVGSGLGVSVEPINNVPSQQYVEAAEDATALEDLKSTLAEGARELGDGRPSMLQDVIKGRRDGDRVPGRLRRAARARGRCRNARLRPHNRPGKASRARRTQVRVRQHQPYVRLHVVHRNAAWG